MKACRQCARVVESIFDDAIEDERRGLLYNARIKLSREMLRVRDKDLPLTTGMALRAELILDRRRVISLFQLPCSGRLRKARRSGK